MNNGSGGWTSERWQETYLEDQKMGWEAENGRGREAQEASRKIREECGR